MIIYCADLLYNSTLSSTKVFRSCLRYVRRFNTRNFWLFRRGGIEWIPELDERKSNVCKYAQIQFLRVDDALDGSWDEDTRRRGGFDTHACVQGVPEEPFKTGIALSSGGVEFYFPIKFLHYSGKRNIFATIVDISSRRFYLHFRIRLNWNMYTWKFPRISIEPRYRIYQKNDQQ